METVLYSNGERNLKGGVRQIEDLGETRKKGLNVI